MAVLNLYFMWATRNEQQ